MRASTIIIRLMDTIRCSATTDSQDGWRQADLAEEVDCTKQQISSYMRGETLPNIVTMIKIANAFDCSLDCFHFVDLGE